MFKTATSTNHSRRKPWFLHHKKRTVVLLIIVVAFGPYLWSRLAAPINRVQVFVDPTIAAKAQQHDNLKIVCYNIAHGRGAIDDNWKESGEAKRKRIKQIAKLLKSLNADVVILNEVDFRSTWSGGQNQAAAIAELAGYKYRVEQRNLDFGFVYGSWSFGNAILSKFPLSHVSQIDFPPAKQWEDWIVGCKRGVVCDIQLKSETQIRVAAIHLEHRSELTRLKSARQLSDLASQPDRPPLFAAGDFNSTPTGFPKSNRSPDGNAMDYLFKTGLFQHSPRTSPTDDELTYASYNPQSVIDWILIPNRWNDAHQTPPSFTSYKTIDNDLSDHRPIVAEIKLPVSN